MFGETVANSLSGQKHPIKPSSHKQDPKAVEDSHPGIVTILDVLAVTGEVRITFIFYLYNLFSSIW